MKNTYLIKIILVIILLNSAKCWGQTEVENHQKYWNIRDAFKKRFVKIGNQSGNSMPLTISAEGRHSCWQYKKSVYVGDGGVRMGWYLSVLATEYKLLKNAGKDVQPTLNELYYAILNFDRLDATSEKYFSGNDPTVNPDQKNGFYMRDDTPPNFHTELSPLEQLEITSTDAFQSPDCLGGGTTMSLNNEPSQDQYIYTLLGLSFVVKCVDNVFVKPTSSDVGFKLVDEAIAIMNRMGDLLSKETIIEKNVNYYGLGNLNVTYKSRWFLRNPQTTNLVARGENFFVFSLPFALTLNRHTQNEWRSDLEYVEEHHNSILPEVHIRRDVNHQTGDWDRYGDFVNNCITIDPIDYFDPISQSNVRIFNGFQKCKQDNINTEMALILACTSGSWTHTRVTEIANHVSMRMEVFDLIYAVLNDENPIDVQRVFKETLDLYSKCEFITQDGKPWYDAVNNWYSAYDNGLDYQLMYNLYHLCFKDPVTNTLPDYNNISCSCIPDFNILTGQSNLTTNFQNSKSRRFPEYQKFDILIPDYLTHSVNVKSNGVLNVDFDFAICNNSVLELDGGNMNIGPSLTGNNFPSTTVIKSGSKIIVSNNTSNLLLNKGSKLIVEDGSELVINAGKLNIEDQGQVIVKKGGKLTINQNAIILLDGRIEIEDDATLHLGDNATLSFTGTGRIKFTDFWPFYQNITCGNNSKINLTGSTQVSPQEDHVVLEVAGDESLSLPDHLAEFKVENATINLGGNCRINAACPIWMEHVRVAATNPSQLHRGLHTFGQSNIHIYYSTFKNGIWGIHADNTSYANSIQINNSSFRNCNTAVYVRGKGMNFDNLEFDNCYYGVRAENMSKSSTISSSFHTGNWYSHNNSVKFTGLSGGNLTATGNDFSWNSVTGLWYKGPALTLRCNNISNNGYGVYASPHTLNMSEKFSLKAGRNKINNNSFHNLQLNSCTNILLEDGYNDLSYLNPFSSYKSVVGKSNNYYWLMTDQYGNIQQIVNIVLNANNNYWDAVAADNNPTQRMLIKALSPSITQPVTVYDASPLPNGITQSISQCPPRIVFDNPTIALPPGDGGHIINGNIFLSMPIEQAVSAALVVQYQNNDPLTAIDQWHDIITHTPYKTSTIGVRRLVDLAYGKMLEAIGEAAADGTLQISRTGVLQPAFERVIEVNNYFLTIAPSVQNNTIVPGEVVLGTNGSFGNVTLEPDSAIEPGFDNITTLAPAEPASDYKRKLELNYNTAFTYRMAERHQTCLDQLNAMQTWVESEDLPLLNYYQCIVEKEISIINNTINKFSIDSIEVCQYPLYYLDEEYMTPKVISDIESKPKINKVMVAPNPSSGMTQIEIELITESIASISLCDITGKVMTQILKPAILSEGINHLSIDMTNFAAGIYIVETKIGDKIIKQKLVKN